MLNIKIGLAVALAALVSVPSIASAQNFGNRGTRNGAIAGAIIGGIIGDQNNNAFTGAVIGGVVGGVAGRAVQNSRNSQFYGGNQIYGNRYGNSFGHYQPHQSFYRGGGYGNSGFYSTPVNNFRGNGHGQFNHGRNNFGGFNNYRW